MTSTLSHERIPTMKSAPKLFAGPTPDGTYITRRSFNEYTWAVAVIDHCETIYRPGNAQAVNGYIANPTFGQWISLSWHGSKALAQKSADKVRSRGNRRIAVVPVLDGEPQDVPQTNVSTRHPLNPTNAKETTTMKATTTKKASTTNAQAQGFPSCYLGATGNFKPGYDARAKSDLRATIAGKLSGKELHRFTKPKATALLTARGW